MEPLKPTHDGAKTLDYTVEINMPSIPHSLDKAIDSICSLHGDQLILVLIVDGKQIRTPPTADDSLDCALILCQTLAQLEQDVL